MLRKILLGLLVIFSGNPAFSQASSNSPVCEGATLMLNSTAASTGSYSWTGPDGFTSASRNPVISGVTMAKAGTYTVTVIQNGQPVSFTTNVTVNDTPNTPDLNAAYATCTGLRLVITPNNLDINNTYTWNGAVNSTIDSLVLNPASAGMQGNYTVSASLGTCTSAVASFQVFVYSKPATPQISTPAKFCEGQDILFSTSNGGGLGHNWSGPSFTSTNANPVIFGATQQNAGEYSVFFNNGGCNSDTAKKTISITQAPPTPSIAGDYKLCEGEDLSLNAVAQGSVTMYEWDTPQGIKNGKTVSINDVTEGDEGMYRLRVSDGSCFSNDTVIYISIFQSPARPQISYNKDTLCEGDEIQLFTLQDSTYSYNWKGPNNFSNNTGASVIISDITVVHEGTYYLTVVQNGCTSPTDSVKLVIKDTPPLPGLSTNAPVCEWTRLLITPNSVDSTVNMKWYDPAGNFISDSIIRIDSVLLEKAGYYGFTVDRNGCTSKMDSIFVRIKARIKNYWPQVNNPACEAYTLYLNQDPYEEAEYLWTGPNGFMSYNQNVSIPDLTEKDEGYYTAVAQNSCNREDTTIYVEIDPLPTTTITGDSTICDGEETTLIATGDGILHEWSTGDTARSVLFNKPGLYSLVVENRYGCKKLLWKNIIYQCEPEIYVPTAFTPDEDNINDRFEIKAHNLSYYKIDIYSRSGNKIFSSEDLNQPWDGKYGGHYLQPGQYFYEIKYKAYYDHAIYEKRFTGTFSLLR